MQIERRTYQQNKLPAWLIRIGLWLCSLFFTGHTGQSYIHYQHTVQTERIYTVKNNRIKRIVSCNYAVHSFAETNVVHEGLHYKFVLIAYGISIHTKLADAGRVYNAVSSLQRSAVLQMIFSNTIEDARFFNIV